MAYFAGVDLGATNVRAVVADDDGTQHGLDRRPTPRGPTGIDVTEGVLESLRAACDAAGIEPERLTAVGIGSIGPFDMAEGAVVDPANLPDSIDRIPLTGPVSKLVDSDAVSLHNDTTAGVIGERYHSRMNPDDMVYLTISSGIGAGVCCDGTILEGWDGNAGEVGHWVVDPVGRVTCGCGRPGHWEAYASGEGIPRYARFLAEEDPSLETDLPLEDPDFDAAALFAAVESDPLARHTVEQVAHWNAVGVANLIHAFAPILVSIGGAVTLNNESLVVERIRERVSDMVITNVPEIATTRLGEDAVLEGALASALTGGTGARR